MFDDPSKHLPTDTVKRTFPQRRSSQQPDPWQISAVLPPEQAWGLWLSRQIVARIMDTFGPSLAGAHVVPVDTRTSDGRRVVG
jgi:hypothetical protein